MSPVWRVPVAGAFIYGGAAPKPPEFKREILDFSAKNVLRSTFQAKRLKAKTNHPPQLRRERGRGAVCIYVRLSSWGSPTDYGERGGDKGAKQTERSETLIL